MSSALQILRTKLNDTGVLWRTAEEERQRIWSANLQLLAGEKLRSLTIKHLRDGHGHVATSFRGQFDQLKGVAGLEAEMGASREAFLARQSKGTFASQVEVAALGELLDVNIVVKPIKGGQEQTPFCWHYAGDDKPTVRLFNTNNVHFHFDRDGSKTSGQGNSCLYHATIQALQAQAQMVVEKPVMPTKAQVSKSALLKAGSMKPAALSAEYVQLEKAALSTQAERQEQRQEEHKQWIKAMDTLHDANPAEYNRVTQQITDDYKLALQLAGQGDYVAEQRASTRGDRVKAAVEQFEAPRPR